MIQVAVPNHLGDAVMALPAIRMLAASLPARRLRLVGRALPAMVLDGQGPWDRVQATWTRDRGSCAVLLAPSLRVAIDAIRRARCRVRIGTPTDWRRALLTHVVRASIERVHQREIYRQVASRTLELLGGEASEPDEADDTFDADDDAGLARWEEAGSPAWLLHPWAQGTPAKRWSLLKWVELGRELGDVMVTGGPSGDDAECARLLAERLGAPLAAGPTCLPVAAWAGVSRRVRGLVLPDTGLAHLASAAGARPVVLFGATDPTRYAPSRSTVVWGKSMHGISVASVLEAVRGA